MKSTSSRPDNGRLIEAPASHAEERLHFVERLSGGRAPYKVVSALRIDGPLDETALERAAAEVLRRHEALRTGFLMTSAGLVRQVRPETAVPLHRMDLRALPETDRADEADRRLRALADEPFDLARPPLLRIGLARISGTGWRLMVACHHIVSDGRSQVVLLHDLAAQYRSFAEHGVPAGEPPEGGSLREFAATDRAFAESARGGVEAEYWRARLAEAPTECPLPYDAAEPPVRAFRGRTEFFRMTGDELRPLFALASEQRFVALLSVWGAVLARYSGQEGVVVGAPFARRTRRADEDTIGFFANTVPLHVDLRDGPSGTELLARTRATVAGGLEHQLLDFSHIIEGLPEHQEGHEHRRRDDWLKALFVSREPIGSPDFGAGLTAAPVPFAVSGARVDLQLTVEPGDHGFTFELEYDTELFHEATITRLIGHFRQLCATLPRDPDRPVRELPLMTAPERAELDAWNATERDYPKWTVPELIEEQARRTPDAVAVRFRDETLTYAELDALANRLARHLREAGVGAQDLVGVHLYRSTELVVSLLAIHKAQAAYVPMDPDYPAERVAYMIADAGMPVVLTQEHLAAGLDAGEAVVLDVPRVLAESTLPGTPLGLPVAADSLAYMIYTSGSTGRPKGVLLEHRALFNRLYWMQEAFPLTGADRVIQKTPFSFDVSVWEFFWPLMVGAGIVVAEPGIHRDPVALAEAMRKSDVTVAHFVPSMLDLFLQADVGALPALRLVFSSGEALSSQTVGAFHRQLESELHNLYGPTEAAIDVSHWPCTPADAHGAVPIGRPIANVRLFVLDPAGNPQPVGLAGELHIGGICLARGYHGRAELTAERFVTDPFSADEDARLYRTGDLARFRPDGAIEYLGRIDDQIKLRGLRIELGEIEACLREAAGCTEAAVKPVTAPSGATVLVGYYRAERDLDPAALGARLGERLPDYMVPVDFLRVSRLPLTPNGKLDRKALPAPKMRDTAEGASAEPPNGPVEELLARCWQEILKVGKIARDSSFFALGGDSILGIRLITAMREAGYELTVGDLFAHHRLAELASAARAVDVPAEVTTATGSDRAVEDSWPASQLQTGMMFHSGLNPEIPVYHDIFRYRVAVPRVDERALVRAWELLAQRHPALRARFDTENWPEPRMVVESAPPLPVEVVDCTGEQDPHAVVGDWAEREKRTPIDPGAAPAYRVRFFVTGATGVVLGFAFHHAILDGWSVASVVEDWVRHYTALLADPGATPAPESVTDATRNAQKLYAELEGRAAADPEQAGFWRSLLADADPLEIPRLVRDAPQDRPGEVEVRGRLLDPRLAELLRGRAGEWGVPLKSVFLAVHLRVLGLVTNRRDVLTGLVSNGRPEVGGAEQALGMFLNTLPFRLEIDPDETWRTLAERCFALEQRLQPRRWYPLAEIQRVAGTAAVSDVIFNFTNFHVHQQEHRADEAHVESVEYFEQTNVPLVVYVGSNAFAGGWEYRIGYDPHRYTAEQIDRYLGYYQQCVTALVRDGGRAWSAGDPLSAAERDLVLPPVARAVPPRLGESESLPARFAVMAARHGERVAVTCGDRRLTYRELDRRANALAARLVREGVRPGDLVALALERDLEMVLSIVATVKAGAVYVPVDPEYPRERIAAVVEDSGARLLIGTEDVLGLFPDLPGIAGTPESLAAITGDGTEDAPSAEPGPDSPAYVIFTSGSTGRPKGVQVTHGNVLRLFAATEDWFGFDEHDRWTSFHSFAFDFSVWEMWGALLYGGGLVVVPFWVSRSAEEFAELVARERITVLNQTPSAFRAVKRELMARGGPGDLALRHVVFGGEALDFTELADWFAHFGDDRPRLVNMYGITETTVHVTYRPIRRADTLSPASLIGEPIPDLGVYLLDDRLRPVPVGTVGELVVSGGGVALGYLGRHEETRRRFVELDLGGGRVERAYRSGDLGRRLPDGDIEYLGRADAQVKVQGYRIETGDISAALTTHPAVRSALAVAFTRAAGNKALAGYFVTEPGTTATAGELLEYLRSRLPGYMVPHVLVGLEQWPLTTNGKIDRKALPDPEAGIRGDDRPRTPPRTAAEAAMAAVWREVLAVPETGIDDTFYSLGGDSIQGIRLVGALRRDGFEVTLAELFGRQTIRALFDADDRLAEGGTAGEAPADEAVAPFALLTDADRARIPAGVTDAYPATQLQLGMIFHTELDHRQGTFHDLISYRIDLPYDHGALSTLLSGLVRGNDALRTSVALGGYSRPLQLVHEQAPVNLLVHDLSHVDEAHQEVLLSEWFEAEKTTGFQWHTAPLMRFFVHRRGPERFNLSLSFHHAILDGWSFSRLMAGLLDDYHRVLRGEPLAPAAPSPLSYPDYVRLELAAQRDEESRRFWQRELRDAPVTKLPRVPEVDPERRWSETVLTFDEPVRTGLATAAARRGVTVRQLCLAAHVRALSLLCQEEDVTTGVFGHGRPEHPDAERMVGLFLNIRPLRARADTDWDALIAAVAAADHASLPHRRFSYASIQEALGGRRLVETAFNFVDFTAYRDRLGDRGERIVGDIRWFEHADFALLVTFGTDLFTNRLNLTLNAAAHVLDQRTVETFGAVYRNLLLDLVGLGHDTPTEALLASVPPVGDREPDRYDRAGLSQALPVLGRPVDLKEVRRVLEEAYAERVGAEPGGVGALLEFRPDSLTALRIVSLLRSRCGIGVGVGILLRGNPVRELLRLLSDAAARG
ncbi:amino acid adenylation domain-containing protein [Amycolatopsis samaneae]|uniref:Amino acid adenylation domain-containing protein n=1 Tax=Amycolatopsis samaneae TaxID=664691 RepID=A0ABW5GS66_9PSEU